MLSVSRSSIPPCRSLTGRTARQGNRSLVLALGHRNVLKSFHGELNGLRRSSLECPQVEQERAWRLGYRASGAVVGSGNRRGRRCGVWRYDSRPEALRDGGRAPVDTARRIRALLPRPGARGIGRLAGPGAREYVELTIGSAAG